MRLKGIAALTALALVLVAGCGGEEQQAGPSAKSVEDAVFRGGIQQNIHCREAGEFTVRGKHQRVFRCSFEEEKEMSGAMRSVDACYLLNGGELIDVTHELPVGTSCAVTGP